MAKQIYNWKRFWCSRTGYIALAPDGFLYDPGSLGIDDIHNVASFETISRFKCLALLGEPGMGKTHAMESARNVTEIKIKEQGNKLLWIDLRSYGSEERLIKNLFHHPTFESWVHGDKELHVFLDSLDECLLRIDTLAALLVEEFEKYPVQRLFLRIACRTAEWPNSLEEGLKQLWAENKIGVYELAPLRRVDVEEAAKANNLNQEAFMQEIARTSAVPLAIKPVTLEFLLKQYRRDGQFPLSQTELYQEGCRLLCEETSEDRLGARLTGALSAAQRMAVAARIAAVTVLSNRYAVWTGIDQGDVPRDDVTVRELCGGKESVKGDQFQVDIDAIKEALGTGLFSSRGQNRMSWAHQTYAEFLAAWHLVKHKMPLVQMMSLLVHPGDSVGKLVPQLHESAAWLAGMVPEGFLEIMKREPEVLLRSDVATADVKKRADLTESLLQLFDKGELVDRDLGFRDRYRKLVHPGLAEQLRTYLVNKSKSSNVRHVAIDIAEACQLHTIQDLLVSVALDPSESHAIRANAAYAVVRVGDETTRSKLKPLVFGKAGDDPNDELKGCGLRALWATSMDANELFTALTAPKKQHFVGPYQVFLSSELSTHLKPGDLAIALQWVSVQQQPRDELPLEFDSLIDNIMLKAWNYLEFPGVAKAFGKAAISRIKHHDPIIGGRVSSSTFINDAVKRRIVVEQVLPYLTGPEMDPTWLVFSSPPLVISDDVPWLIERLLAETSPIVQLSIAQLLARAFDRKDPHQFEAIYFASQRSSALAEALAWLLKPISLDSPEAQRLKADYRKRQEILQRREERKLLKPSPSERISKLLDECESGNSDAWWQLNMALTLEPNSTHYGDELESDLTILPSWPSSDTSTRARIVEAAKKYVTEQDPHSATWLGTNTLHRPAFAGYRALRLLMREAPGFISSIPADIWKKWSPIILAYPISSGTDKEEPHHELVRVAYQFAPNEIIETLKVLIDKENASGHLFITRTVEKCWDVRLASALLMKVRDEQLKPECMGALLSDLIEHDVAEARAFAESLIPLPPPANGDSRSKAIVAARVLLAKAKDAGWPIIWPAIQQDAGWGREIFSAIDYVSDIPRVARSLKEDQLADLYIWLVQQYPYSEDPQQEGAHWVGPRERASHLRDSILHQLGQRGTTQACAAIQRIMHQLPGLEWLKWTLLDAQTQTRRLTWTPSRPQDILKITGNKLGRLVQSGDQLLDVLIESLRRLEARLKGETPASRDLWDRVGSGNLYRPIDEDEFSDYIKRFLDEDLKEKGVIINREVRIHRGERTDIHVDAVVPDEDEVYGPLSVIVEAKGCWNPKLKKAMQMQLVDQYLKDNICRYGLYLIGWFNCDKWDAKDTRKKKAPKLNIEDAQAFFDAQAKGLSQQGLRIRALVLNAALQGSRKKPKPGKSRQTHTTNKSHAARRGKKRKTRVRTK